MRFYNPTLDPPISTFVPDGTPWDMILKTGEAKQKRWDETEADMAKLPGLFNLNIKKYYTDSRGNSVLNPDWQKYEEQQKAVNDQITQLVNDEPDLGSYSARRKVSQLATNASKWLNTYGKAAEGTSKAYDETYKQWREADRTDDSQGRVLSLDQFVHGYQGADKQQYSGSPIGKYVKVDELVKNYGSDIKSQMTSLKSGFNDAKTKNNVKGIAEYSSKMKEITPEKVLQTVVNPVWEDYKTVAINKAKEEAYHRSLTNGTSMQEELERPVTVMVNGKEEKVPFFQVIIERERNNIVNNAMKYVFSEGDESVNFSQLTKGEGDDFDASAFGEHVGSGPVFKNPLANKINDFSVQEYKSGPDQAAGEYGYEVGAIGYNDKTIKKLSEMDANSQTTALKTLSTLAREAGYKNVDLNNAYIRARDGLDLTPEQAKKYYPLIQNALKKILPSELTNVNSTAMSLKESKFYNNAFLGDQNGTTVEEAGTGLIANSRFMDKSGKVLTWSDIQDNHKGEEKVSITSKPTHLNPYTAIQGEGDLDWSNVISVNIGGKTYVTTDLKGAPGSEKDVMQTAHKIENAFYTTAITGLDDITPIADGVNVRAIQIRDAKGQSKRDFVKVVVEDASGKAIEAEQYVPITSAPEFIASVHQRYNK